MKNSSKMRFIRLQLITFLVFSLSVLAHASTNQPVIQITPNSELLIGKQVVYFQEQTSQPLALNEALLQFESSAVETSKSDSLSLGINTNPVWIKAVIENQENIDLTFQLSVEIPWLDYINIWQIDSDGSIKEFLGGDGIPFSRQTNPHRFSIADLTFSEGFTFIYIRVQTIGPMAIPIRLSTKELADSRKIKDGYQYGFLYGLMSSLAIYNLLLFLITRRKAFGLYSAYLFGYIANSLSYTGHLHYWLGIDVGPLFQDWMDTFLMITYSVAGLHFARILLNTKEYAAKLDQITQYVANSIPIAIIICALFDQLFIALLFAFALNSSFAVLFVWLGVAALKAKENFAKLFLFSSVQAAACIGISTMAVGGLLPLNDLTFKLIEIGMSLEALLLAIILAALFRNIEHDKQVAQVFARTDALTQLLNRRGFEEFSEKIILSHVRHERHLSIVIFDIDLFKQINDRFGHQQGDKVLEKIGKVTAHTVRKEDVSARWGGEEFIILLPETNQREAFYQSERLRQAIENINLTFKDEKIEVTCSFGVFSMSLGEETNKNANEILDHLIKFADQALYASKACGRNQVFYIDQKSQQPFPASANF